MARLKKKAKRKLLLIFVLIICLLAVFGHKYFFDRNSNIKDNIKKIVEPENPIKTYTAKLIATGDGLIHRPIYTAAYNNTTKT